MLPHAKALRPVVARDLAALAHHRFGGQLVALGWTPHGESYTFADENGSHAGASLDETGAFLLLPHHVRPTVKDRPMRPRELRAMALTHLGRLSPDDGGSRPPFARRTHDAAEPAAPAEPVEEKPALRIATLNTHSCIGMDGRCSPNRIARLIETLDADVIALQELDVGQSRSRGEDQLRELSIRTGLQSAWCRCLDLGDGAAYGHGLLSRYPILSAHTIRLPHRGSLEQRAALHSIIDFHGSPVHVLSTHFGLTRWERITQAHALLGDEGLGQVPATEPVVLCGDLNTAGGSPPTAPWLDVYATCRLIARATSVGRPSRPCCRCANWTTSLSHAISPSPASPSPATSSPPPPPITCRSWPS